jgi:hypothetical protein
MSVETVRNAFLVSAAINYGILILWWVLFTAAHDWLLKINRRMIRLSPEYFDPINICGITLYKLGIILFNLVPAIALFIVG